MTPKPCAHCGHVGIQQVPGEALEDLPRGIAIMCEGCAMATPFLDTYEEALVIWNHRADQRPAPAAGEATARERALGVLVKAARRWFIAVELGFASNIRPDVARRDVMLALCWFLGQPRDWEVENFDVDGMLAKPSTTQPRTAVGVESNPVDVGSAVILALLQRNGFRYWWEGIRVQDADEIRVEIGKAAMDAQKLTEAPEAGT